MPRERYHLITTKMRRSIKQKRKIVKDGSQHFRCQKTSVLRLPFCPRICQCWPYTDAKSHWFHILVSVSKQHLDGWRKDLFCVRGYNLCMYLSSSPAEWRQRVLLWEWDTLPAALFTLIAPFPIFVPMKESRCFHFCYLWKSLLQGIMFLCEMSFPPSSPPRNFAFGIEFAAGGKFQIPWAPEILHSVSIAQ